VARDDIRELTDRWITGFTNRHTQRAYATDIRYFLSNTGFRPSDSAACLADMRVKDLVSIARFNSTAFEAVSFQPPVGIFDNGEHGGIQT
jgi:hypothetical protein